LIASLVRAALFALLTASASMAQEFCDRPIPPEDLVPPRDDPEFRDFLNSEYEDYLGAAESYINCLGREHQSTFEEMRVILDRWTRYFGDDARIGLATRPTDAPETNLEYRN
jgi:hypothetical protein